MTKLLSLTPEKTSSIEIVQLIQYVPEFIDELAKEERLIHKELDAYLAESATALSRQRLQSNLKQELAAKMPFMVASLNIDSNTRKPYCVLPGNLVYPRSPVMPLISDLLKNFRARSKTMGGGIAFTRTLPGRKEVQLVQSTEAIAYLIRSVANAYFTNYMATPDGQQALMQSIIMPKDGHIPANEIIAHSPLWKRVLKVDEQDKARSRGRTRR